MATEVSKGAFRKEMGSSGDYYRGLLSCVHCGFCLPACPTYRELGTEMDSPRGRISLMRAAAESGNGLSAGARRHISLCLGCRACEPACPSGVPYGSLLEWTRAHVARPANRPQGGGWRERMLRSVFGSPRLLDGICALARLYQVTGVRKAASRSGILRALPPRWRGLEEMLPAIPPRRERRPLPARIGAGGERGVELFAGCIGAALFGRVNRAAAAVLAHHGFRVEAPRRQVCCGALHLHNGDREGARALARRNLEIFTASDCTPIIATAAGCGAMLKEYAVLLDHDPKAVAFSRRVEDVSEFLGRREVLSPAVAVPLRVTYQDPCHLAHVQGVRREPRVLLDAIPGLELVEMPESDRCCGSAGTYTIAEYEMSMRLLKSKMDSVASTGAQAIVTANPGCHIQLEGGTRKFGPPIPVYHVVELLARAYGLGDPAAGRS